jgi:hypothetical protein
MYNAYLEVSPFRLAFYPWLSLTTASYTLGDGVNPEKGRSETDPAEFWYKGEIGFFDFYIVSTIVV